MARTTIELKTVMDITRKEGNDFKNWARKIISVAVLNNIAKTSTIFLKQVYNEIYNNEDIPITMRFSLCAANNHLDFLANYQPTEEVFYDFIFLKAEFVRLMLERSGAIK